MKYLLVLAIVFIGLWLWRGNRRVPPPPSAKAAQPQAQLQDMVGCAVCELHVPRADASVGRTGTLYCSADHRQRAEG
jgi:uncharacterized protein